jgi:hypothetical protein
MRPSTRIVWIKKAFRSREETDDRTTMLTPPAKCLFLLLLLAALVAPGSAAGAWSAPVTISSEQFTYVPHVAVSQSGNAVFVWEDISGPNRAIRTRARSAGGTLGPIQTLSPAGYSANEPQVAIAENGSAVFTWYLLDGTTNCNGGPCSVVQTRARSATGALSPVQTLSAPLSRVQSPLLGVDESGDAVFAWYRYTACCARVEARARSATGVLSPVQALSPTGQDALVPDLAVAPGGDAVFAWGRVDSVEARARSATGALTAVQAISRGWNPKVGVDESSNAVVAWSRSTTGGTCCYRIEARARSATGVLSGIQTLSPPGRNALDHQLSVNSSGNAVFTWRMRDGATSSGCCYRIQTRARSANGNLSAVQILSPAGLHAFDPQLAVDPAGNAVFIWDRGGIEVRRRLSTGTLSAVHTLSPGGSVPDIGVDRTGKAVAVWQDSSKGIQAATGP